ncbi:hypothetical protein D1156_09480 [Neglecta sp. X58]|nr:hypothetical protein [Neglectibacter sp. X58]
MEKSIANRGGVVYNAKSQNETPSFMAGTFEEAFRWCFSSNRVPCTRMLDGLVSVYARTAVRFWKKALYIVFLKQSK